MVVSILVAILEIMKPIHWAFDILPEMPKHQKKMQYHQAISALSPQGLTHIGTDVAQTIPTRN